MPTLANVSIKDSSSWTTLLNMIYPVGSYYISNNSTSPAGKFGGTWSQITGKFLYTSTSGGTTGGSNNQTLTVSQIPNHMHRLRIGWGNNLSNWSTLDAATGQGDNWGDVTPFYDGESLYHNKKVYNNGDSPSHNNMPAYRTCCCWYRTA